MARFDVPAAEAKSAEHLKTVQEQRKANIDAYTRAELLVANGDLAEDEALKANADYAVECTDDLEERAHSASKSIAVVKAEQAAEDALALPTVMFPPDAPAFTVTFRTDAPALTDDERVNRFLRVLDIARELPPIARTARRAAEHPKAVSIVPSCFSRLIRTFSVWDSLSSAVK
jgi:chorismate mutase